ncbi:MAG: hypothetical protein IJ278_04925 [Clostridia bacterium]|nr:hypothetical protein [Clostridia bacterium]
MKIVKRILIILVCILIAGYAIYKIAYPYVAPILFDYIVETNLDAFVKLEKSLSESLEPEETHTPSVPDEKEPQTEQTDEENPQPIDEPSEPNTPSAKPAPTKKPEMEIQSVKTTMGVFTGEHLARALKNISPKDKTRIISLCQSAVSASDILKVSKMMLQDGLSKEQQKYIENYLRDNLSVPSKREILEILKQY